ncbi:MAG: N-acetyl-L,L-diaminopimelate deacetylase homolog [uncultured Thermomicrobiales bacterium]|uniref:N-acetyl-L,L-diaminopimelate deacetylase homolog n=1 Tax=uncultured Thermomicrobiales bacterium TaxID=1645740 RepID=A0A6J4UGS4_9BACT|nr:MAG: N-acetyl-L,L-diaminopimelate deacetylase homolog [uncultured Thermomicrobiales bacterium]
MGQPPAHRVGLVRSGRGATAPHAEGTLTLVTTVLKNDVDEILPGVIADRRFLHEHPELGFQEVETSRFVAERLAAMGVEDIRTGIAKTGVTGLIRGQGGSGPGKTLLIRADMDALPIQEENDVDYRSKHDGVMHACGHDAHTAMLLGVTRLLQDRRGDFAGTVKVLFQPAEEGPGGAKPMIEAGALEDPKVDAALGLHVAQAMPLGKIGVRTGPAMAASDRFEIRIQGKGGHGARPQATVDPIAIGAQIVVALQTIVSRETDPTVPAVVTVGAFLAGQAFNVIPDTATLRGTVRSFDNDERQRLAERIQAVATGIAAAMRAEATVDYSFGYPPTVNDAAMTDIVRAAATSVVGAENVVDEELHMGAEDMSYFLEAVPGSFFFVGSMNEDRGLVWGHHHPRFDIDEVALSTGMATMVESALGYLNG